MSLAANHCHGATHIEDVAPDELQRCAEEAMRKAGGG